MLYLCKGVHNIAMTYFQVIVVLTAAGKKYILTLPGLIVCKDNNIILSNDNIKEDINNNFIFISIQIVFTI